MHILLLLVFALPAGWPAGRMKRVSRSVAPRHSFVKFIFKVD
ncbi:hypothetical protein C4K24_2256 [Pseudomonas chlororaphis subsp. aurantiaca]|nr:hypothetical protein C4K24_2256 [Pseudomonas chlororaphis subsp. aurantiaca]AZD72608.1 hypothetical protein C4K16_2248 [Pseudomonas chlororaphis subsp. aurantiaca]